MITAKAFAGKHYAVLGLARSGLATVEALLASGARVTAWDDREEARNSLLPLGGGGARSAAEGLAPNPSVSFADSSPKGEQLGVEDFTTTDLTRFDSIVVTPGLPLNRHPIAARAREANVEIIGDVELFARARPELPPHKVVGITGTNGKSTTTALVHHILQIAGVPTLMGGNIGLPILSQEPLPEGGVYVLELSSYQIDLTKCLDCDVAVLLNLTPDHLDRYENFEAYAASKERLLTMQSAGKAVVFGSSAHGQRRETYDTIFNSFETIYCLPDYVMQDPADLWDAFDSGKWKSVQSDWPTLQGPHNAENAGAAINVSHLLGLDDDNIDVGLRTYPGLHHRMERVLDRDGVLFVNDSKATNVEAAAPALAAYPKVRWIVGGQAKAETLGDSASHLDHVVAAYTIGEAGPMFARLLRDAGVTVIECETLENAVERAAKDSQAGDTVLLSPASASFDQFRDFEARGGQPRVCEGVMNADISSRIKAKGSLADPSRYGRSDRSAQSRWFWEIDRVLVLLIAILIGIGLIAVAAASPAAADRYSGGSVRVNDLYFFYRQLMWIAGSLPVMIVISMMNRSQAKRFSIGGTVIFLALLAAVPFIGVEKNGAVRWIELGVGQLQPSEFLKPFFVVTLAWILSLKEKDKNLPVFLMSALMTAIVAAFLMKQPDFGSTIIYGTVWIAMLALAGLRLKIIAMLGAAALAGIVLAYFTYDVATIEIDGFLFGEGDNFQVENAMKTLTAGGLFGMGPGGGTRKFGLPEPHTDYIFSVIGEEFGLIACLAIALLYLAIVARVLIKLLDEESSFAILAAAGLAIAFGLQAMINMAVNVQIAPSKGMTLPFISYGGSSMLALSIGMGLLLAFTRRNPYLTRSPYVVKWSGEPAD